MSCWIHIAVIWDTCNVLTAVQFCHPAPFRYSEGYRARRGEISAGLLGSIGHGVADNTCSSNWKRSVIFVVLTDT